MLYKCFYLLLALGFAMNLQFTDVKLLAQPYKFKSGIVSIHIKNFIPKFLAVSPSSLRFTPDEVSLQFDSPTVLDGSLDGSLLGDRLYSSYDTVITAVGGIKLNKKGGATKCAASTVITTESCDLSVHVLIKFKGSDKKFFETDVDVCSQAADFLMDALKKEEALAPAPPLGKGNTAMKRSSYFKSLRTKTLLKNLIGIKTTVTYVSDTSMRFTYGMSLPIEAKVNTERWSASLGARLMGSCVLWLWHMVKQALSLPSIDSVVTAAISTTDRNITVSMSSPDGFFADLVKNRAALKLESLIPAGTHVSFDLVANDLRCNILGLLCSVPADDGFSITNVRVGGFGDADALVSSLLAPTLEDLVSRITTDVMAIGSSKKNGRLHLSVV